MRGDRMMFDMSWYSFIFPNTTLNIATLAVGKAFQPRALQIKWSILIVAWFFVFTMMIWAIFLRQVLWLRKEEDTDEIGYKNPKSGDNLTLLWIDSLCLAIDFERATEWLKHSSIAIAYTYKVATTIAMSSWNMDKSYSTALTFPVSTSYTHPLMVTLSGMAWLARNRDTSSLTPCSKFAKGRKSRPISSSFASWPRFCSTILIASSFVKVSMPHPVCLISKISSVLSSCCEMTRDRKASFADPPALRMTWASPRAIPKAAVGSMRASMQVTTDWPMAWSAYRLCWRPPYFNPNAFHLPSTRALTDGVTLGRRESKMALMESRRILGILVHQILLHCGCHNTSRIELSNLGKNLLFMLPDENKEWTGEYLSWTKFVLKNLSPLYTVCESRGRLVLMSLLKYRNRR